MYQIILFGGGDQGGLICGPNGVRPIPPFDGPLLDQIRAVASLSRAAAHMPPGDAQNQLRPLLERVTNVVIGELEGSIGPLNQEVALVYQDEDGGFTCGSTGGPPLPFPWPPKPLGGGAEFTGRFDATTVEFVEQATRHKIPPSEYLEDPRGVAERIGLKLHDAAVEQLYRLAPSRVDDIEDPIDRQIVEYFHRASESPEHNLDWATRPYKVARELGVELSSEAIERLIGSLRAVEKDPVFDPSGPRENAAIVAGIVGVVIMLVPTIAGHTEIAIHDRSRIEKF